MSMMRVFHGTTILNRRATATVVYDEAGIATKVALMFEVGGYEIRELVIERIDGVYICMEDGIEQDSSTNLLDVVPTDCAGLVEHLT